MANIGGVMVRTRPAASVDAIATSAAVCEASCSGKTSGHGASRWGRPDFQNRLCRQCSSGPGRSSGTASFILPYHLPARKVVAFSKVIKLMIADARDRSVTTVETTAGPRDDEGQREDRLSPGA